MRDQARLVGRPFRVVFAPAARKDARKAARSPLRPKIEKLLELLGRDLSESRPPYEKLVGDLEGACSRRINIQHRLVYEVRARERVVKVLRMWTHYE